MPYDPTLPADGTKAKASEMRAQFNSLKDLLDAGILTGATVDAVNTVAAGQPATVAASLNGGVLHLSFDIPQGSDGPTGAQGPTGSNGNDGQQGPPGTPGEISAAQLATAIGGTSNISNSVGTLGLAVGDPPTQAEMQALANKLDELITALRR